jgi:hypothetical protein
MSLLLKFRAATVAVAVAFEVVVAFEVAVAVGSVFDVGTRSEAKGDIPGVAFSW